MEDSRRSPWLSIWLRPKETIRTIVSENPNRSLGWLAAIYGFSALLNFFQSASFGAFASPLALLVAALILSPFCGYIVFALWSWIVLGIGKLFKGEGSFAEVRAAFAWSCVPFLFQIPLWGLMIALFGPQLFINFEDGHLLTPPLVTLLFFVLIAKLILAVWSLVIYLNALAEVERYPVWRAIGTVVIAWIVMATLLTALWMGLFYLMGTPLEPQKAAYYLWKDGLSVALFSEGKG